jgi:hypothetical protein
MPDVVNTFLDEVKTALAGLAGIDANCIHVVPSVEDGLVMVQTSSHRIPCIFIEDSGGAIDPWEGKYLSRRLRIGVAESSIRDATGEKVNTDTAELLADVVAVFNFSTATSAMFCVPVSESSRAVVSRDGLAIALAVLDYDYRLVRG